MATRKGTPREIATQGFSSNDGLGVATQGFIEPIIGDLILGGGAGFEYIAGPYLGQGGLVTGGTAGYNSIFAYSPQGGLVLDGNGNITVRQVYPANGGLIWGGAADVETTVQPVIGGNLVLGGSATISNTYVVPANGGLITDGEANVTKAFNYTTAGGLIVDGAGNITVTFTTGDGTDGGLVTGGQADVDADTELVSPVGGRGAPWRRRPNITWKPAEFNVDDLLQPMDFLKKIQDALTKTTFQADTNGGLAISGRARVMHISRDLADSRVIVSDSTPLEPVRLDVASLFSKGSTAKEIAEFEDRLLILGDLSKGEYRVTTGAKARFVQAGRKGTSGKAKVTFVSGASTVSHFDMVEAIRNKEDEMLLMEDNSNAWFESPKQSRNQQEEDEMRLLGLID